MCAYSNLSSHSLASCTSPRPDRRTFCSRQHAVGDRFIYVLFGLGLGGVLLNSTVSVHSSSWLPWYLYWKTMKVELCSLYADVAQHPLWCQHCPATHLCLFHWFNNFLCSVLFTFWLAMFTDEGLAVHETICFESVEQNMKVRCRNMFQSAT